VGTTDVHGVEQQDGREEGSGMVGSDSQATVGRTRRQRCKEEQHRKRTSNEWKTLGNGATIGQDQQIATENWNGGKSTGSILDEAFCLAVQKRWKCYADNAEWDRRKNKHQAWRRHSSFSEGGSDQWIARRSRTMTRQSKAEEKEWTNRRLPGILLLHLY
jgi:hypothetical protein